MYSSRMRTVRRSGHLGGVCPGEVSSWGGVILGGLCLEDVHPLVKTLLSCNFCLRTVEITLLKFMCLVCIHGHVFCMVR